jgi:hypothetical protein
MPLLNDRELNDFNPATLIWTSGSAYTSTGANVVFATIPPDPKRILLILGQSNSGSSEIVEFRFGGATNGITLKGEGQPAISFTHPFIPTGEIEITRPYSGGGRFFWQAASLP